MGERRWEKEKGKWGRGGAWPAQETAGRGPHRLAASRPAPVPPPVRPARSAESKVKSPS